jgi:histone H1/5
MIHEAIVALKDRTGSSAPAISKWILANNEHAKSIPPNMFKSRLNLSIKQGVNDGRFTKIKGSYKINSEVSCATLCPFKVESLD